MFNLVKRKIIATLIFVCILERPLELIFVGLLSKDGFTETIRDIES